MKSVFKFLALIEVALVIVFFKIAIHRHRLLNEYQIIDQPKIIFGIEDEVWLLGAIIFILTIFIYRRMRRDTTKLYDIF